MVRQHPPGLEPPLGCTQNEPQAGASQRHSTEREHTSDAAQTPVSPHCGTETVVQELDGDAQGSDQLPDQAATMLDELAENDDEENRVLLKAVSPQTLKASPWTKSITIW